MYSSAYLRLRYPQRKRRKLASIYAVATILSLCLTGLALWQRGQQTLKTQKISHVLRVFSADRSLGLPEDAERFIWKWLEESEPEPGSVEVIKCESGTTAHRVPVVRLTYRSTNSLGGKSVSQAIFAQPDGRWSYLSHSGRFRHYYDYWDSIVAGK